MKNEAFENQFPHNKKIIIYKDPDQKFLRTIYFLRPMFCNLIKLIFELSILIGFIIQVDSRIRISSNINRIITVLWDKLWFIECTKKKEFKMLEMMHICLQENIELVIDLNRKF